MTVPIPEGYVQVIPAQSEGQSVFYNRKENNYISPDRTGHKQGIWKRASKIEWLKNKDTRDGTYDENMNRVAD